MDSQETSTYYNVLIIAAISGIIIFCFIIAVVIQQRKHLRLQRNKIAAEINTLEQERARVAGDLHDELGPTLSAVKFKLSSIESLAAADHKTMLHAMGQIDRILTQVRQISNGLMPTSLLARGPVYAIQRFIEKINSPCLSISITQVGDNSIASTQYIHVYRILQEIIHNTIRHANAKKMVIQIGAGKNIVTVAAADDGKGFNMRMISKKGHFGLSNLKNRVDILNGRIDIESSPGKGTRIYIEFPQLKHKIVQSE